MKDDEAIALAYEEADRNPDGSVNEKDLIDRVAELLDFDPDEERRQRAKRVVGKRTRPGTTPPEGVLQIPGEDWYAYEPARLIKADEDIVEQRDATPRFKRAEAMRAQANLDRVAKWSRRKHVENSAFSEWAIDQLTAGRPPLDIVFDTFVKETGFWGEGEAPAEDPDVAA